MGSAPSNSNLGFHPSLFSISLGSFFRTVCVVWPGSRANQRQKTKKADETPTFPAAPINVPLPDTPLARCDPGYRGFVIPRKHHANRPEKLCPRGDASLESPRKLKECRADGKEAAFSRSIPSGTALCATDCNALISRFRALRSGPQRARNRGAVHSRRCPARSARRRPDRGSSSFRPGRRSRRRA